MKKVIVLVCAILISAAAASAQSAGKGEAARTRQSIRGEKRASSSSVKGKGQAAGVLRVGPSTTYLKNGLSAQEVVRLLGSPASASERREGDSRLATFTFVRGQGRILVAEFENGVLVSSHTEQGEGIARNGEAGQ